MQSRISCAIAVSVFIVVGSSQAWGVAPLPVGTSIMRIEYPTLSSGMQSFEGVRPHNATNFFDVTNLGGAPNVGAHSGVNSLGTRPNILIGPNESLMRHAFYKMNPSDEFDPDSDFFPDVDVNGNIRVTVEDIHFDQPVAVVENTFLFHVMWDLEQIDSLPAHYHHPHNFNIPDPFRDFDGFFGPGLPFHHDPVNHATLPGGIAPVFTQSAPDTISFSFEFPYMMLEHLENNGQMAPPGLPAPAGFLENVHFHIEYLVVPEPATGLIMLAGATLLRRRR